MRVQIKYLKEEQKENSLCRISGRLVQLSPATLSLEDETDRRTFGFPNYNPKLSRVRQGDILELTLRYHHKAWRVESYQVLVPCMLTDDRQRQWMKRWLSQGNHKRRNLVLRDYLSRAIRDFLWNLNFIEVATPSLVSCPGMEPHLTGFSTDWQGPETSWRKLFYLPTSPEFHLKKLLALGYEKMFEFCRCFRNQELSALHQPEFTMLEWYRAYEGYEQIMDDVEEMVHHAAQMVIGNEQLFYQGRQINLSPPWKRRSVRELFLETFEINLDSILSGADLARAARQNGYEYVNENETFEDVFFKLFLTEVEAKLGWEQPEILFDYPAEMAALSRLKPGNGRYCERFEVYIAGIELANAFGELNNADEQARRFDEFAAASERERRFHYEPDGEFLDALRFGMPPAAGIALGFDRLAMLFANETTIKAVCAFPHAVPQKKERNG